jgi:hypothetical protein
MFHSVSFYRYLLVVGFFSLTILSCKQNTVHTNSKWYSFYNEATELTGYKDAAGKVKLPAKFGLLTRAHVFDHIIAVDEHLPQDKYKSYYLLKNGKQVGKDSTYSWDFTYDCESEQKIRFRDRKTDKVGFFDHNGRVVIPAVYNDAQPFHNGLALVIRNAKRICWEGGEATPKNPCEHWSWIGTSALINPQNEIVVDSVDFDSIRDIDWFSLKISDRMPDTSLYTNLKGVNGKYYAFINYEKEFKKWFYRSYFSKVNTNDLLKACFDEVYIQANFKDTTERHYTKTAFVKQYGQLLSQKISTIGQPGTETAIMPEALNSFIYTDKNYKQFYTDCGDPNSEKYPQFDVVTTHLNSRKQSDYQESLSFIRTSAGYKLIGIYVRDSLK